MSASPSSSLARLALDEVGRTECLLGNEAIVRGALEAGVAFACGYPGTPSSEITDAFAGLSRSLGIRFEYSINEKICVEMAFAASLAGARSICAMKHLGLMVAGDPLSTIPYIGIEGGMVIVSAGDPSCGTSPNEQDQRHLGPMLHLPVLDPATPAEALALTKFAFELSERSRLPVLLRTTTRVCHSRAPVTYGELTPARAVGFTRDRARYVPVPKNARRMRLELIDRIELARAQIEAAGLLRCRGSARDAILATGAPAAIVEDLLTEQVDAGRIALWTLSGVHPLPERALVTALRGVDRLLVVEELSSFLEDAITSLCQREGIVIQVFGKRSGHLPQAFEYGPEVIERGAAAALELTFATSPMREPEAVPPRNPSMCPGCPHRNSFMAARAAFDDDQLFFNDIGCYTLGFSPPLEVGDALLCMGAGFTLAAGVSRMTGKRTVGFMGDGTFFHAGMPALLNAVKERENMVAVILDNQVTAMTGFQESPADHRGHDVSIERIVRALGVEHVEVVDPYDMRATIAAYARARDAVGLSVVLLRRSCPVYEIRLGERRRAPQHYGVDDSLCRACGREELGLRCSQGVTHGYERHLARTRALQTWPADYARPASAPCSERCPLSLCIQGYVGHVAAGEYAEALGHILERTPLPDAVCRTCHRPCETACLRADVDEPIAINDLKRFVVDWADAHAGEVHRQLQAPENGLRVAIVGAGPAGLSAAHELRMRGYAVTLFDAAARPGGVLSRYIPRYRLPDATLERDVGRVLELGVEFVGNTRIGRDLSLRELRARGYAAILLAIGAHRPRMLSLEGSDEAGTPELRPALEFLAAARAGEASPISGEVVVIGGGNAAIDAARTARRLGASAVTIACLEDRASMPALHEEIDDAESEGILLLTRVRPTRLAREGLEVVGSTDAAPRLLACALVVVAIGQDPDLTLFDGGDLGLGHDEHGRLLVDPETCETAVAGVYAGGDLVPGERTVTGAMASGLRAAWSIDRRLRGAELADRRRPPPIPAPSPEPRPRWEGDAERSPRRLVPSRPLAARGGFDEVREGYDEAAARAEARRCLACGLCGNCRACTELFACPALTDAGATAVIDPSLCIDCGACTTVCSNGAIRLGAADLPGVSP